MVIPSYGKKSLERLSTAHPDLQRLFHEVIKEIDITIIYGHRSPEEQFELYKIGRELQGDKWVVVGKIVTNLDGFNKQSEHNFLPSNAVDTAPYPIDWSDISRFKKMGGVIKRIAKEMNINISWGGDWKSFKDYPHTELKGV